MNIQNQFPVTNSSPKKFQNFFFLLLLKFLQMGRKDHYFISGHSRLSNYRNSLIPQKKRNPTCFVNFFVVRSHQSYSKQATNLLRVPITQPTCHQICQFKIFCLLFFFPQCSVLENSSIVYANSIDF